MKKSLLYFVITFLSIHLFGQNSIQSQEIKLTYRNGYEIFHICTDHCTTTYDDKKEYYWYSEFSKIKSTKGGSGGSLLNGNYKFYDEHGNLRIDKSYTLGLNDGIQKEWDSLGNIISQNKYEKGELVNFKNRTQNGRWIEYNLPISKINQYRKVYTDNDILLTEETMLPNKGVFRAKNYYTNSGKLKEQYFAVGFLGISDYLIGKYVSYYENGSIEMEGYYDTSYANIKIGTWKYYNQNGTLDGTLTFKSNVEKWDNGNIKVTGGYIFDTNTKKWLRTGKWKWYTYEGKLESEQTYLSGEETD